MNIHPVILSKGSVFMGGPKKKTKFVYNNPISHIIFFMPWNQLDKGVEGKSYCERI